MVTILAVQLFGQFDQFQIDLSYVGVIFLDDLNGNAGSAFHLLQNVESTPPSIPLDRIGAIGDLLQLAKDEVRNHQGSFQETGLTYVSHAAINDYTSVQDFVGSLGGPVAEDAAERREIQILPFVCAAYEPDIRHKEQNHDLGESSGGGFQRHTVYDEADQARAADAQDGADSRSDQGLERALPHSNFDQNNKETESRAKCEGEGRI